MIRRKKFGILLVLVGTWSQKTGVAEHLGG